MIIVLGIIFFIICVNYAFEIYRIRKFKRWLRAYEWRYFNLAEWARENRSEEQWTEKLDSHRAALSTMKAPWRLPK